MASQTVLPEVISTTTATKYATIPTALSLRRALQGLTGLTLCLPVPLLPSATGFNSALPAGRAAFQRDRQTSFLLLCSPASFKGCSLPGEQCLPKPSAGEDVSSPMQNAQLSAP